MGLNCVLNCMRPLQIIADFPANGKDIFRGFPGRMNWPLGICNGLSSLPPRGQQVKSKSGLGWLTSIVWVTAVGRPRWEELEGWAAFKWSEQVLSAVILAEDGGRESGRKIDWAPCLSPNGHLRHGQVRSMPSQDSCDRRKAEERTRTKLPRPQKNGGIHAALWEELTCPG